MSDSSSEEEINEALKESANCGYINDLFLNPPKSLDYASSRSSGKPSDRNNEDEPVKDNDFEFFLAQRLSGRLDETIKIVERKRKGVGKTASTNGIRLFSGSPVVSELVDNDYVPVNKRRSAPKTSVDYEGRAEEAAVSPDWVKDENNTAHWKDSKKLRILEATVIKKHANGGMECSTVG